MTDREQLNGRLNLANGELLCHLVLMAIAVIAMTVLLVSMGHARARNGRDSRRDLWMNAPREYLHR